EADYKEDSPIFKLNSLFATGQSNFEVIWILRAAFDRFVDAPPDLGLFGVISLVSFLCEKVSKFSRSIQFCVFATAEYVMGTCRSGNDLQHQLVSVKSVQSIRTQNEKEAGGGVSRTSQILTISPALVAFPTSAL
ncbi:unnamed protein product, partial [Protopolystoma xenopodis]